MSVGRNEPCPCGSGQKYKRCCIDKDAQAARERAASLANDPLAAPTRAGAWPHEKSIVLTLNGSKRLSLDMLARMPSEDFLWKLVPGHPDTAFGEALALLQRSPRIVPLCTGGMRLETEKAWVELHEPKAPIAFQPGMSDSQVSPWLTLLWVCTGGAEETSHAFLELYAKLSSDFHSHLIEASGHLFPWRLAFAPETLGKELPPARPWEWIYLAEIPLPADSFQSGVPLNQQGDPKARSNPVAHHHPLAVVARAGIAASELPHSLRSLHHSWNQALWSRVWVKTKDAPAWLLPSLLCDAASAHWKRDLFPLLQSSSETTQIPPWVTFGAHHVNSAEDRAFVSWLMRVLDSRICPVFVGVGREPSSGGVPLTELSFEGRLSASIHVEQNAKKSAETHGQSFQVVLRDAQGKSIDPWMHDKSRRFSFEPERNRLVFYPDPALAWAFTRAQPIHRYGPVSICAEDTTAQLSFIVQELEIQGVEPPSHLIAKPATGRPEIWLEESGEFRFCIALPEAGIRIWNLPRKSHGVASALASGIVSLQGSAEELPHKNTGAKRTLGLKALRHQGIAAFLLGEMLSAQLGRPAETELATKAASLLEPGLGNERNLADLCGTRIQSFVSNDLPARIGEAVISPVSIADPERFLKIEGIGRPVAEILMNRIRAMIAEKGPEAFQRERMGWFSVDPLNSVFIETSSRLGQGPPEQAHAYRAGPAGLETWLPLIDSGVRLYWKGAPIEGLAPSELRIALDLHSTKETQGELAWDWFELHPEVFLSGTPIDPNEILSALDSGILAHGGKLYRIPRDALPSLKRLERFWAKLASPKPENAGSQSERRYTALPRSEVLEMLALRRRGVEVVGDPDWQRLIAAFDALDDPNPRFESIPGFQGELKPYQRSGVEWLGDLHSLGLGGILADDMGLGKTVQVLAHIERIRGENTDWRGLVVVPSSLVYNWKAEAERFVPKLPVQTFSPGGTDLKRPGLWIITYGLLTEHQGLLDTVAWDLAIFDEAQNLKNLTAQRTQVARRLKARVKLALSGTPLENHVGEFFSILDLVVPGALGEREEFFRRYVTKEGPTAEDLAWLRAKARPLVLRREKRQVLSQLPPKIETENRIEFDPEQQQLYRDTALSWNKQVSATIDELGESKSQLAMLTALLRLRQICSDPAAVPGSHYTGTPPKVETLCERVAELISAGESCIVFTQFLATLERAEAALKRLGVAVGTISGATPRTERERVLREFQESEQARALIMTLKTGGVGLNLTRANHVFHLDPWWNPAVEDQATDRAHRMGQSRVVHVVRYLMRDSVEERIRNLQLTKRAQFEALMGAETPDDLAPTAGLRRSASYRLSRAEFEFLTGD